MSSILPNMNSKGDKKDFQAEGEMNQCNLTFSYQNDLIFSSFKKFIQLLIIT